MICEVVRPDGEAAAKCRVIGNLEFTMSDGEAAGGRRSVKEGRVAEMAGVEVIGKFREKSGLKLVTTSHLKHLKLKKQHCRPLCKVVYGVNRQLS